MTPPLKFEEFKKLLIRVDPPVTGPNTEKSLD
jgi:hypothetical protein